MRSENLRIIDYKFLYFSKFSVVRLQKCKNDHSRISYIRQLPEVQQLSLRSNTSPKSSVEAQSCEELHDMLVRNEADAARALEVIQRAIQKTPPQDTEILAVRLVN